jgi:hypothetical protein
MLGQRHRAEKGAQAIYIVLVTNLLRYLWDKAHEKGSGDQNSNKCVPKAISKVVSDSSNRCIHQGIRDCLDEQTWAYLKVWHLSHTHSFATERAEVSRGAEYLSSDGVNFNITFRYFDATSRARAKWAIFAAVLHHLLVAANHPLVDGRT